MARRQLEEAESLNDSEAHSCRFCARIVLDYRDSTFEARLKSLLVFVAGNHRYQEECLGWFQRQLLKDLCTQMHSKQWRNRIKSVFQSRSNRLELRNSKKAIADARDILSNFVFFHDYAAAKRAAQQGCSFFGLLLTLRPSGHQETLANTAPWKWVIAFKFGIRDTIDIGIPNLTSWWTHVDVETVFSANVLLTSDAPSEDSKLINAEPMSDKSIALYKSWYHDCVENHSCCSPAQANYMPTRLLEIQRANGEKYLRLTYSKNLDFMPYAALSYCWGAETADAPHFTTTNTNIKELETGMPIHRFPPTIKDAVQMTETLGIRYLWVDALCIVQSHFGSSADIESHIRDKNEAVRSMFEIYHNARITISASRANHVQEGFLNTRISTAKRFPGCIFKISYVPRFSNLETIQDAILVPQASEDLEPLDTRGWAFQERLLSTRLIDFGSRQTRFVCRKVKLEERIDGWRPSFAGLDGIRDLTDYSQFQTMQEHLADVHNAEGLRSWLVHSGWQDFVAQYSRKMLGDPQDRLPAVAALAQQFSSCLGPIYAAGLWARWLPWNLLWYRVHPYPHTTDQDCYIAPSWSWASIIGPARYVKFDISSYLLQDLSESELNEDWSPPSLLPETDILSWNVELADQEAQFGAVKGGRLLVQVRSRRALWRPDHSRLIAKEATLFRPCADKKVPCLFYVDELENSDSISASVTEQAVELIIITDDCDFSYYGLVLQDLGSGNHKRIGMFRHHFHFAEYHQAVKTEANSWHNIVWPLYQEDVAWLVGGDVRTFTII